MLGFCIGFMIGGFMAGRWIYKKVKGGGWN